MRRHALWMAMVAAGLLAACGGGGSDSAGDAGTAKVSLSGTAAKGPMANATVTAHAVKADGTMDETPLATGETDAKGAYTLSFDATQNQPVVIRVTAKAGTTHRDEVSGVSQPLPVGFSMRSIVVPASSGTLATSASITPFSEMAVAAAQKATGGITAANATQAVSTVSQLLGFNPIAVQPVAAADAAGAEQKQMAVMLAAVSQLAADGAALGCTGSDAGTNAQCVVEELAKSASTTSIKLEGGSGSGTVNVSSALAGAVTTVLTKPDVVGPITAADVQAVTNNLACEGDACKAATATPESTAIAAAKSLFSQIRTDIASVFVGSGSDIQSGPLNGQAMQFESTMKAVQLPVDMVARDLGAMLTGVDLLNDFNAGRTTETSRGRGVGQVASNLSVAATQNYTAVGCTVYGDAAQTVPATGPSASNNVGCRASYYVTVVSGVRTNWRHGITIKPTGTTGQYTYTISANTREDERNAGNTAWVPRPNSHVALSSVRAGTLEVNTDANGHAIGFAVKGELPPAFVANSKLLAAHHGHEWNLSGTRVISGFKQEVSSLAGTVVAHKTADKVVESTLKINSFKTTEIAVTDDASLPTASNPATQGEMAQVEADVEWTAGASQFVGAFKAVDSQWDKSGTRHAPTTLGLSGSLRNLEGGAFAEFMAGNFTAKATGYANFDATLAESASNTFGLEASFLGSVTAPNRPRLEVTVGATGKSHSESLDTLSMQYRTVVNGAPRTVVALSRSVAANGDQSFKLSEAAANLSLEWADGAGKASVKRGDLVIGELDASSGMVTFTDNSHVSFGL